MEAKDFSALRVSLAAPKTIKEWSYGEVLKPETINYRRLRPEKDGLFCEAIFGPTRDWQCYCGKYKNIRYKGLICEKCGVEVTRSSVRRERMGHIALAAPVAHVWYTRRVPSYLGMLLDISRRNLDRVLYFAQYVVTSVDEEARLRKKASIDRELETKRRALMGDIDTMSQQAEADHSAALRDLEQRAEDINVHYERELARLQDDIVREGQQVEARLSALLGEAAGSDIDFASASTVIAARGELVTEDHIARVQRIVNNRLSSLQEELEGARKGDLAALNAEAEASGIHALVPMSDGEREIRERIAHIENNAEKAHQELDELHTQQFLTETRYRELKSRYGSVFQANMGAEAFHDILQGMDLDKLAADLWNEVRTTKSKQKKKKATKRLRVVESLRSSSNKPEWMILTMLPVIPPDLRPMVQLDGGRFATSDLNDLYRRVINRNNRLKHLLELGAPDVIVRNEKRMLQEAVDSLIDNSQRTKAMSRRGRRELKSLSDMLKGKKGRFRRNLLGKRVDYSGRSVIVIGPRLKLHQCGLPKTMALELYRPFVISRLCDQKYASNVKGAKRLIERERPEVWEALEEVIKHRPVLLNRAPTLHRLGIQAFEPQLVEGKAIQIHPLVCSAFNADFDGDQMAVHVPLSDKAVQEARELMLSTRNLLKPSDGQAIVAPAKDMVLGIYYLTMDPTIEIITRADRADDFRSIARASDPNARVGVAFRTNGYYWAEQHEVPGLVVIEAEPETDPKKVNDRAIDRTIEAVLSGEIDCMLANGYEMNQLIRKRGLSGQLVLSNLHERPRIVDMDEVEYAYNIGRVGLHTPILLGNVYDNREPQEEPELTTVGRAIFNRILPDEMRYKQGTFGKKQLQDLVQEAFLRLGMERTPDVVDAVKDLGFRFATVSGTTIAVSDLTIPAERDAMLQEADQLVEDNERSYQRGTMTDEERYQKVVEKWTKTKDDLQERVREALNPYGPVAVMAISGSTKGGFGPITQLAGMRGLMADPSGRIIDLPIRSHFREGLTPLEYFISTHGARKGLADTALRTADAGYLTRRLVDVTQDMIINRTDCLTEAGIWVRRSDDIAGETVAERIVGRCAASNTYDPETGELIVERNQMIDEIIAARIQKTTSLAEVHVRSPLTCSLMHGICALCYGRDLGRGEMVEIGTAVGIIAAQSIGEPGTQLTLRTFHSGGTATSSGDITSGLPRVEELFEARKKPKGEAVIAEMEGTLRLTREGGVRIATIIKSEVSSERYALDAHEDADWEIMVVDDQRVKIGTLLARDATTGQERVATMEGIVFVDEDAIYIRFERIEEVQAEIPSSARLLPEAYDGAQVYPGQQLTEGAKSPHKILRLQGEEPAQLYLLSEVQKVYRTQGVNIADKHFEIVIRKMLSKVQITKSGDSELLPGELSERLQLIDMNDKLIAAGKEPAQVVPIILGVTKAALTTDSFLSASSFQHTIRVLAGAAIEGKSDNLYGLKENVIIGKLIPAGTGFHTYQDRELVAPQVTLAQQGALDTTVDFDEIDRDDDERERRDSEEE